MKLASLALLSLLSLPALAQNAYNWGGFLLGEINFPEIKSKYGRLAPKPEKKISGQDLINNHKPISKDFFQKLFYPDGNVSEDELNNKYQAYDREILNRRFVDIYLARILDFKALENKIEPKVSDARVVYVMRTVLLQNFRFMNGKDAVVPKSNDVLYNLFKNRVGKGPVRFSRDWKICEEGLNTICDSFKTDQFALPPVTLSFSALPATVTDFMLAIKEKLQPFYLKEVRTQVLISLAKGISGNYFSKANDNPSFSQLQETYERIKNPQFKILNFKVNFGQIKIESEKSADIDVWLNAFFQEKLSANMQLANQIKEPAARRTLIFMQRRQIFSDLLAGLQANFPDAIITNREVTDQFGEDDQGKSEFPHDRSFLIQEYPFQRMKNENKINIVMGLESATIDLGYKTINQVLPDLQDFVKNKYAVAGFRAAIYKLFDSYRLNKTFDTCFLENIPCNESDPTKLVKMMFSEEDYDPKLPSGMTDISTMHRVLSISMPDFEAVYNTKIENILK
ncbi:MAG: hypothetical protein ACOYL6_11305 [Bacteriovoracaceae bacterium]